MKKKIGISYTKTSFKNYWTWITEEDMKDDLELVELSFEKIILKTFINAMDLSSPVALMFIRSFIEANQFIITDLLAFSQKEMYLKKRSIVIHKKIDCLYLEYAGECN
jgi:hypothetical protein